LNDYKVGVGSSSLNTNTISNTNTNTNTKPDSRLNLKCCVIAERLRVGFNYIVPLPESPFVYYSARLYINIELNAQVLN